MEIIPPRIFTALVNSWRGLAWDILTGKAASGRTHSILGWVKRRIGASSLEELPCVIPYLEDSEV